MKILNLKNIMEEKELLVKLGAQFRELRIENKMSIKELAVRAETTRRTVYIVENGSNSCSLTTYFKLAKAIGFKINFQFLALNES